MDLTGEADGPPQKVGTPAADLLAGNDAALAVARRAARRAAHRPRPRDRRLDGREHDALHGAAAHALPRLGRAAAALRRQRQRDRDLPGVRDRRRADHARPRQRRDLEALLGTRSASRSSAEDPALTRPTPSAARRARRSSRGSQALLATQAARPLARRCFARRQVPAGPIHRARRGRGRPGACARRGLFYRTRPATAARVPQVGLGIRFDGARRTCRACRRRGSASIRPEVLREPARLRATMSIRRAAGRNGVI